MLLVWVILATIRYHKTYCDIMIAFTILVLFQYISIVLMQLLLLGDVNNMITKNHDNYTILKYCPALLQFKNCTECRPHPPNIQLTPIIKKNMIRPHGEESNDTTTVSRILHTLSITNTMGMARSFISALLTAVFLWWLIISLFTYHNDTYHNASNYR